MYELNPEVFLICLNQILQKIVSLSFSLGNEPSNDILDRPTTNLSPQGDGLLQAANVAGLKWRNTIQEELVIQKLAHNAVNAFTDHAQALHVATTSECCIIYAQRRLTTLQNLRYQIHSCSPLWTDTMTK